MIQEIKESEIDLLFVSEVWEKETQNGFNKSIESMTELDGLG